MQEATNVVSFAMFVLALISGLRRHIHCHHHFFDGHGWPWLTLGMGICGGEPVQYHSQFTFKSKLL